MKAIVALCSLSFSHAFVPVGYRSRPPAVRRCAEEVPADKAAPVPKPQVLSEIVDETTLEPAWIKYQDDQKGITQPGINPKGDYEGFIDVEGFDGGDGQVGTVGSKGNFMPTFKDRSSVSTGAANTKVKGESFGGSESKKTQKITFGYTTGYADKLKESGMTAVDEYGDDRLMARRQQLENWANQQAHKSRQVKAREEFAEQTGTNYDARRATDSYFETIANGVPNDDDKFTMIKGDAKPKAATAAAVGLVKGPITQKIEMTASYPRPSFATIAVQNDVMGFAEFAVGFAEGSTPEDFQISPTSGELNGRRGAPTELALVFKPNAPGGVREAFIVVQTEESKWTYHVVGKVQ
jgi:hypothetical protein